MKTYSHINLFQVKMHICLQRLMSKYNSYIMLSMSGNAMWCVCVCVFAGAPSFFCKIHQTHFNIFFYENLNHTEQGYMFFWQGCATNHTIEIIHWLPQKTFPVTKQYLCHRLIHLLHTGNGLPQTKRSLMCLGPKSTYETQSRMHICQCPNMCAMKSYDK